MISICYLTARKEPKFNWFFESLNRQITNQEIEIIIIDYFKEERGGDFLDIAKKSFNKKVKIIHVEPLPSFCQGKYRVTKNEYWDASIARNTGFVFASNPYVAFVDDCSVLGEKWLDSVIEGAQLNQIVLGAYQKHTKVIVENGLLISSECLPQDIDSRWKYAQRDKISGHASWFFGASFCMPLEFALDVNGFDELQAISSYEDCPFGIRLEKAGYKFFYDKRMFTIESIEHHVIDKALIRQDPEIGKDRYLDSLKMFGINESQYSNIRWDVSHLLLEITQRGNGYRSFWNGYDLRQLRENKHKDYIDLIPLMNFPTNYYATGQLLSDM